jgi:hypothetical protein
MSFLTPAPLLAVGCLAVGLGILLLCVRALSRRRALRAGVLALSSLLLVALGALFATLDLAVRGYSALTREEVAARIRVAPSGEQRFLASFELPDGRRSSYRLAGDELYVDAQILKWRPLVNLLGLHTAYDLDRVAGRYSDLHDERELPRTVFSLARERHVDLFALRRRLPFLDWLVDAEYGSASFVVANRPAHYELRVSTSGLLVRPVRSPGAE